MANPNSRLGGIVVLVGIGVLGANYLLRDHRGTVIAAANVDIMKHNAFVSANDRVIDALNSLSDDIVPEPQAAGPAWTPDKVHLPSVGWGFAAAREKFHAAAALPGSAGAIEPAAGKLMAVLDTTAPTETDLRAYVESRGYDKDHGAKGAELTPVFTRDVAAIRAAEHDTRDAIFADNMAADHVLLDKLAPGSAGHAALQVSLDSREAYNALIHAGPPDHRDYTAFAAKLDAMDKSNTTLRAVVEHAASGADMIALRSFSSTMDRLLGQGRELLASLQSGSNVRANLSNFVRMYNAAILETNNLNFRRA